MNFLYLFYFICISIAVFQDFKRREIDDWLNLFIFFSGILFLVVNGFFNEGGSFVFFGFFTLIVFLISLAFYFGRVFMGGDVKLFFALSPLVYLSSGNSFFNLAIFTFLLFFLGSIYSLVYSFILFFKDWKKNRGLFGVEIRKKESLIMALLGIMFLAIGVFEKVFLLLSLVLFLGVILISFAKTLEKNSLKKLVFTKDLREGDWLFKDVRVGGRLFKKSWEGMGEKDIKYLKKFNKKVYIKDGVPYALAFLLTLVVFYFRDFLLNLIL